MAKFVSESALNNEITKLIDNADKFLILVSPYIKLHERDKASLRTKMRNPKLNLIIIFGKNEHAPIKSLSKKDLEFFMEFPNVYIGYEKRLHAKCYASEDATIITSMNLYEFSQNNNVETGLVIDAIDTSAISFLSGTILIAFNTIVKGIGIGGNDSIEQSTSNFFTKLIQSCIPIYHKVPRYKDIMLGLSKEFVDSEVMENRVEEFFKTGGDMKQKESKKQAIKELKKPVVKTPIKKTTSSKESNKVDTKKTTRVSAKAVSTSSAKKAR